MNIGMRAETTDTAGIPQPPNTTLQPCPTCGQSCWIDARGLFEGFLCEVCTEKWFRM